MITRWQLRQYQKYRSRLDLWYRNGNRYRRNTPMTEADWALIGQLTEDVQLLRSGRLAPELQYQAQARLARHVPDAGVRGTLEQLTTFMFSPRPAPSRSWLTRCLARLLR